MKKQILVACFAFFISISFAQVKFLGLSQTFGKQINVIYNRDNLGDVKTSDTLYLIDISAIHLFKVNRILNDSISFFNFIGDELLENGKPSTYFDRRVKATYLSTIPTGDYLISRELSEFFAKNNFHVCLKLSGPFRGIAYLDFDWSLRTNDASYEFAKGQVKVSDKKFVISNFYRLDILSNKRFHFAVVEDATEGVKYLRFFANDILLAKVYTDVGD